MLRHVSNLWHLAQGKQPPQHPDEIHWKIKGGIEKHLTYLLEAREYISRTQVPEDTHFIQSCHGLAGTVGEDPYRPALLNASYHAALKGYTYASLSYPLFVPAQMLLDESLSGKFERLAQDNLGLTGLKLPFNEYKIKTGFSPFHIQKAGSELLQHFGVEFGEGKIGVDGAKDTQYLEWDVSREDYKKAWVIMDLVTRTNASNGEELIEDIENTLKHLDAYAAQRGFLNPPALQKREPNEL